MSDQIVYGPFISRKQAKEQGLRHYFTGKPCKHGHIALRSVSNHNCMVCSCKTVKKHYADKLKGNEEFQAKNRARTRIWAAQNREHRLKKQKAYDSRPEVMRSDNDRRKQKYHDNLNFKLKLRLRTRLLEVVGAAKSESALTLVG